MQLSESASVVLRYNSFLKVVASPVRRILELPCLRDFGDFGMLMQLNVFLEALHAFAEVKDGSKSEAG